MSARISPHTGEPMGPPPSRYRQANRLRDTPITSEEAVLAARYVEGTAYVPEEEHARDTADAIELAAVAREHVPVPEDVTLLTKWPFIHKVDEENMRNVMAVLTARATADKEYESGVPRALQSESVKFDVSNKLAAVKADGSQDGYYGISAVFHPACFCRLELIMQELKQASDQFITDVVIMPPNFGTKSLTLSAHLHTRLHGRPVPRDHTTGIVLVNRSADSFVDQQHRTPSSFAQSDPAVLDTGGAPLRRGRSSSWLGSALSFIVGGGSS